jgi:hypothetical protein
MTYRRKKSMTYPGSRFFKLLALWLLVCSQLLAQRTQYVILVVVDGTRYTETFGDSTHANIPIIWNQLRPLGTIYTWFWNDGATMTNSGHASILSGTREALKNNGTELPHHPTVFEYFRRQTGAPANQCWVALGKTKLQMLAFSDHKDYGSRYGASVKKSSSEYDNLLALKNTTSVLAKHHPKLLIVNVPASDEFAHNGLYQKYVGSIGQADSIVASIWNAIQTDSLLRDKTTMIVTNDHGRHTTDYTDHGDQCEGCRHIMLLIIGPDTPAGVIDSSTHKQVDIAPTVGRLLGFETPYSVGEVIESAVATSVHDSLR